MSEKKLPGRPFVKGDPRCGRPKDPMALIMTRQMTQGEYKALLFKILNAHPDELSNFNGTALEKAMAKFVDSAIRTADPSKLEAILNRVFGKVPDKVEVTENDLSSLTDEQLYERMVEELDNFKQKRLGGNNG